MDAPPVIGDRVFRFPLYQRILGACVGIPILLACNLGVLWFLTSARAPVPAVAGILVFDLFFSAVVALSLRSTFASFVEWRDDGFRCTDTWGRQREYSFGQVKGFRLPDGRRTRMLQFVLNDPSEPKLLISLSLERSSQLRSLIEQRFVNLDEADLKKDTEAILSDTSLGGSAEDRQAALVQARIRSRWVNGAGAASCAWCWFFAHPYHVAVVCAALVPLAALVILRFSSGLIVIAGSKTSARPNVFLALVLPTIALVVRAAADWHLVALSGMGIPLLFVSGGMLALFVVAAGPDFLRTPHFLIPALIVCCFYGGGVVAYVNCGLDSSSPRTYDARVVSRRMSRGKSVHYYVTVSPWIDGSTRKEISLDAAGYSRFPERTRVQIGVCKGVLGIPWFFLNLALPTTGGSP